MTVGKDVCPLFLDVINCMQTEDIELKKLIYLYAINYARSNPDIAILAVNTFVKVVVFHFRMSALIDRHRIVKILILSYGRLLCERWDVYV